MSETAETEAQWVARVGAWHASGMSARTFSEGKGFAASTLRWWEGRLKRASKVPPSLPASMARVLRSPPSALLSGATQVGAGAVPATLALELDGVQIAVRRGFDAELLRQVVQALGGAR